MAITMAFERRRVEDFERLGNNTIGMTVIGPQAMCDDCVMFFGWEFDGLHRGK